MAQPIDGKELAKEFSALSRIKTEQKKMVSLLNLNPTIRTDCQTSWTTKAGIPNQGRYIVKLNDIKCFRSWNYAPCSQYWGEERIALVKPCNLHVTSEFHLRLKIWDNVSEMKFPWAPDSIMKVMLFPFREPLRRSGEFGEELQRWLNSIQE